MEATFIFIEFDLNVKKYVRISFISYVGFGWLNKYKKYYKGNSIICMDNQNYFI